MQSWKIHRKSQVPDLPEVILTAPSGAPVSNLPPELAALLPTRPDEDSWISEIPAEACVGLFMANPLSQRNRIDTRLQDAGVKWVTNLPSVSQHDEEFIANLSEVGLGPRLELENLARYLRQGFKCIATVSSPKDATYAASVGLTNFLVMPHVQAYEGGFPSELTRNRAVAEVANVLAELPVTLLGLVSASEAAAKSVWPPQVSAVIERPRA